MDRPLIIPVILSGGCGSRLWPMSRQDRPKQFLKLLDDHSLLQATIQRALSILELDPSKVVTVTHKSLKADTVEQMLEIDAGLTDHILSEPNARNTSAAILYAAVYAEKIFGTKSMMWVLPSDHHIGDTEALAHALEDASSYARAGRFVAFGIKPNRAETDFGYICKGSALDHERVFKAEKFVEKPCLKNANALLETGNYLWNSGMYLMRPQDVIDAYNTYEPDALKMLTYALNDHTNLKNPLTEFYALIKKEPFEKAILEKSASLAVVETDPQWSDIGSWGGLWEASDKNNYGNVTEGRVICKNTTGSIIKSASGRLVTCVGLKDLVISDTPDTLMIADKHNAGQLKHLVGTLQKIGSPEAMKPVQDADGEHEFTMHTICIPPGQTYEGVSNLPKDVIYIVTTGDAEFTLSGETRTLSMRETVNIPANTACSFFNSGSSDLKILEMHFGETADDHEDAVSASPKPNSIFAA